MSARNPLELSDEEILGMSAPPADESSQGGASNDAQQETQTEETQTETPATEAETKVEETPVQEESTEATQAEPGKEGQTQETETKTPTEVGKEIPGSTGSDAKPELDENGKPKTPSGAKIEAPATEATQAAAPNYEEFYKKVMAPFKANGETMQLKTPDEVLSLMQMGANYTAKMKAIAPQRKLLMMLDNNGLLDEGKLSFLIDLQNKNPEAIKKLIKDSGIDPLEIDTSVEPNYQSGNHRVSDEEVRFNTAVQDIQSNESGAKTLAVMGAWDQASKGVLWTNPEVISVIHEQRELGIYDRIEAEINRRKILGQVSAETPFLTAYKAVGDEMANAGVFEDLRPAAPPAQTKPVAAAPTPVAKTVAAPKPQVSNGDKANAASPTRITPQSAKVPTNPLAMSDEDFLKMRPDQI